MHATTVTQMAQVNKKNKYKNGEKKKKTQHTIGRTGKANEESRYIFCWVILTHTPLTTRNDFYLRIKGKNAFYFPWPILVRLSSFVTIRRGASVPFTPTRSNILENKNFEWKKYAVSVALVRHSLCSFHVVECKRKRNEFFYLMQQRAAAALIIFLFIDCVYNFHVTLAGTYTRQTRNAHSTAAHFKETEQVCFFFIAFHRLNFFPMRKGRGGELREGGRAIKCVCLKMWSCIFANGFHLLCKFDWINALYARHYAPRSRWMVAVFLAIAQTNTLEFDTFDWSVHAKACALDQL